MNVLIVIKDKLTEQLHVFDKDGNILAVVGGKEDRVELTDDIMQEMKNSITLHNHPRFPDGSVTSFSMADIEGAIQRGEFETRIITANGDRFSMKYGNVLDGMSQKERNKFGRKISREMEKEYKEQARKWAKRVARREVTIQEATLGMSDSTWKVVADRFGLEYIGL